MLLDFRTIMQNTNYTIDFKSIIQDKRYKGLILRKSDVKIIFPTINYPHEINIFSQFSPVETQHSKILCSILNPESQHSCGTAFLGQFFKVMFPEYKFDKNCKWLVTAEKERFDIKISNFDKSVIVILENKSNCAGDQPNQLYRYWYDGIRKYQDELSVKNSLYHILYISPHYGKYPDEQTMSIPEYLKDKNIEMPKDIVKVVFYQSEINQWLENCLKIVDNTTSAYFYIKQYKDYWRYYYEF